MSDLDNTWINKWPTTPRIVGMLKLKHLQDGFNVWDALIDPPMT
jgi:hypothetical protein